MTKSSTFQPMDISVGVQPTTERTSLSSQHYAFADKIRFENGIPKKIGGWERITFDFDETIQGTVRSLFTDVINGQSYSILGSNEKLYSLIGTRLDNITPLVTTATLAPNSIGTDYDTLGSDPMTAVSGSPEVTVSDPNTDNYEAGDIIYINGATAFAGLDVGDLNGDFIIRSIDYDNDTYTINVGVNATSSASGGGVAVDRASGLVIVDQVAHGLLNGDRMGMTNSTDVGGLLAAEINIEAIVRNATANQFMYMTIGEATSSVTGGGGASVEYFEEIPDGLVDETNVIGYGAGLYGVGLYGTALVSSSSRA